jgi:hypothetical protein
MHHERDIISTLRAVTYGCKSVWSSLQLRVHLHSHLELQCFHSGEDLILGHPVYNQIA